jgi:hypothetical protein
MKMDRLQIQGAGQCGQAGIDRIDRKKAWRRLGRMLQVALLVALVRALMGGRMEGKG